MSDETTEENQQEEEKQLTPEEYKEARKKALEHLKSEIEYVETEKKYENLVADVEEAKTRGVTAIATRAQFFAQRNLQQQQAEAIDDAAPGALEKPTASKPPRPLKKD